MKLSQQTFVQPLESWSPVTRRWNPGPSFRKTNTRRIDHHQPQTVDHRGSMTQSLRQLYLLYSETSRKTEVMKRRCYDWDIEDEEDRPTSVVVDKETIQDVLMPPPPPRKRKCSLDNTFCSEETKKL
ncbi:hypothetical protein PROFUN_10574 [Planoprotostelium fungivorum]|uniref:Uncharacterized protein n=1 Tax=Planoprotostelium fungivorum TaxID=1890364 RepID=A0A2P6ND25_9EUKA|nr:hypothetical protein PROFUN_10574 [Planoprotostelium fungivorum]